MGSVDGGPPPLVECELVEAEYICPTGRGFTKETWHVGVNDAWISIWDLYLRGSVGSVSVELVNGFDPRGRTRIGTTPPQHRWRRVTCLSAPRGTRLYKHTLHPLYAPVRKRELVEEFVLRRDHLIVPLAAELERQRPKSAPPAPLPNDQNRQYAQAALARVMGADMGSAWPRQADEESIAAE